MSFREFLQDESGQSIVEYFMLMTVVIAVVGALKVGLKKTTVHFWTFFAKKIAAPCPTCAAGDEFNL